MGGIGRDTAVVLPGLILDSPVMLCYVMALLWTVLREREREREREVLHLSSPEADAGAARVCPGRFH